MDCLTTTVNSCTTFVISLHTSAGGNRGSSSDSGDRLGGGKFWGGWDMRAERVGMSCSDWRLLSEYAYGRSVWSCWLWMSSGGVVCWRLVNWASLKSQATSPESSLQLSSRDRSTRFTYSMILYSRWRATQQTSQWQSLISECCVTCHLEASCETCWWVWHAAEPCSMSPALLGWVRLNSNWSSEVFEPLVTQYSLYHWFTAKHSALTHSHDRTLWLNQSNNSSQAFHQQWVI